MTKEEVKKRRKKILCILVPLAVVVMLTIWVPLSIGEVSPSTERDAVLLSETRKAVIFQTREAKPTRTPSPIQTKDTRDLGERLLPGSPFERCVNCGSGIRYVITGNSVSGVSLTWQNDTGGTNQGDYEIPFCIPYTGFEDEDFLYISAQIILGEGNIKCYIYDDNLVVAQANANGFASIATCSR